MPNWIIRLSDDEFRTALGLRFETIAEEAFNILRWTLMVGFIRYVSLQSGSRWFDVLYWAVSALLFAYLASLFLMRPEIPFFSDRNAKWKRIVQSLLNYALCMAAFMVVMLALNHLAGALDSYRFGSIRP